MIKISVITQLYGKFIITKYNNNIEKESKKNS